MKEEIAPSLGSRSGRQGGFFQRVREAWFGPGEPQVQIAPLDTEPRQFDYPTGYNLRITPRGDELVSFSQLRALADAHPLTRMCIETRKDQIEKFTWSVVYKDKTKRGVEDDRRVKEIERFFAYPDRVHTWKGWIRMLVEDMLVVDATSIYLRPSVGGKPYAAELIDGSTIRPLIDETGRRPVDGPAYQQIIKGVVASEFTSDELLYCPRNPRSNRIYGYSPVEQLITLVNISLRRQLHVLQYYTEGNVPEALIGMPDNWNVDQIAKFQKYWDGIMEGNTAERRHAKFIPGQIAKNYVPTKEPTLKDEYDEWEARLVAYAFSIPPTQFVKQGMNKATAQVVQDVAIEEGLLPITEWLKSIFDRIIQEHFGYEDLQFQWQEIKAPDAYKKAQTDDILVRLGVKSVDQVAEELGLEAPGLTNAIFSATGVTLVEDVVKISKADAERKINPPEPTFGPDGMPLPPGGGGGGPFSPDRRRRVRLEDDAPDARGKTDDDGKAPPARKLHSVSRLKKKLQTY